MRSGSFFPLSSSPLASREKTPSGRDSASEKSHECTLFRLPSFIFYFVVTSLTCCTYAFCISALLFSLPPNSPSRRPFRRDPLALPLYAQSFPSFRFLVTAHLTDCCLARRATIRYFFFFSFFCKSIEKVRERDERVIRVV